MKRTNFFSVSAGMLALASSAGAQAADSQADCLLEEEISAIVVYAMPQLIAATQTGCKAQLSPQGFIATGGAAMGQHYAERADATWPLAKSALVKFGGGANAKDIGELLKLPDSAMRPFLDGMIQQKVAEAIKPGSCHDIEHLAEVVSQIDPATTGALIGAIAAIVIKDKDKPKVCAAIRS